MTAAFHDEIIAVLPRLRLQALALTRNHSSAEDLVQDAICNALAGSASFIRDTNFPAWMHRILRNRFISDIRRHRAAANIDDVPEAMFAIEPRQARSMDLVELGGALQRLPSVQRDALLMATVHGLSYDDIAERTGCAVGTAKSRVFRARRQLAAWLS